MTMRSSVLLWLLFWQGSGLARDPFSPPEGSHCDSRVVAPQHWHLQGIVGSAPYFIAWLMSPEGKSHRLKAGMAFPVAPWQVAEITSHALVLTANQRCAQQQIVWALKGGFYETDRHTAGSDAQPTATGRAAQSESDF